jgi:hypothetical protein
MAGVSLRDDPCECICNHSGACTGCGICYVKAFYENHERQVRALFGIPPLLPITERPDRP